MTLPIKRGKPSTKNGLNFLGVCSRESPAIITPPHTTFPRHQKGVNPLETQVTAPSPVKQLGLKVDLWGCGCILSLPQ